MPRRTRHYHSPQRQRAAENTRLRIVRHARRLFARRGYAATRMEAIAQAAGVAVPTLYAVMGSKRAILLALIDLIEREAGVARLEAELETARAQPMRQLELLIGLDCRLFERNLDVLEILRGARAADPNLESIWHEGARRRRVGQASLVRAWSAAKALSPLLRPRDAADILWVFTGPDVYRLFVVESAWSTGRFRRWLRDTLGHVLFRQRTRRGPG